MTPVRSPSLEAGSPSARDATGHDMPAGLSSFLGRDAELAEIAGLVEGAGLVTLAGPPGMGKSRLGLELARKLESRYPDGARLVELASVGDGKLVPQALASALSVQEVTGQSLTDTLLARLRERRLLLVLDNCEHVLRECGQLVDALLDGCRRLSIITTSRQPLGISRETVWQVPPLSVPDLREPPLAEELEGYGAVRLFTERARAVEAGFGLNDYVAPAVAEICRRLDGIPLAVELAAARVELLTPPEIAQRLGDRFDLLTSGSSSPLPRHQTLEAAIDWSYALLSAAERALLRRLSVFSGGFGAEAVAAVCSGTDFRGEQAVGLLGQLASKSLAVVEEAGGGRHRLLETIRAYAGERLEESGEAPAAREAHARFYLALAEQAEPELDGARQGRWLECLETERAELRSALEWALGHGRSEWALRLAGALVSFWHVRCHFSEGQTLLRAAVSASSGSPPALEAKAVWGAGFLTLMAGDNEDATRLLEQSLARFRELRDPRGEARALLMLANAKQELSDPGCLALAEQSAALARDAGDSWCLALALAVAGYEHLSQSRFSAAGPWLEECVQVSRRSQDKSTLRQGLLFRGQLALHQGDHGSAVPLLEEAMALAEELGDDYSKGTTLQYLGGLALRGNEHARARELLDRAITLLRETRPGDLQISLVARARVARFEGERALAHRLLEEALALATTSGDDPTPALLGSGELAAEENDIPSARRHFEDALDRSRSLGVDYHAAMALDALARLARAHDDADRELRLHTEALALHRRCANARGMVASVEALASLTARAERGEDAALLYGAVNAVREARGYIRQGGDVAGYEADLALLREALSPRQIDAALRKGEALSLGEAVAQASNGSASGASIDGWSSLTEREQQVAVLVAEGLSNPEIAERLVIALETVKNHVSSMLSKLGLTRRTELAREIWGRSRQPPAE